MIEVPDICEGDSEQPAGHRVRMQISSLVVSMATVTGRMHQDWEDRGKEKTSHPLKQMVLAREKVRRKGHVGLLDGIKLLSFGNRASNRQSWKYWAREMYAAEGVVRVLFASAEDSAFAESSSPRGKSVVLVGQHENRRTRL
jgi:hypothetical protein